MGTVCRAVLCLALTAVCGVVSAAVELASPFADGMVLQQGRTVPVWGWAKPNAKVAVSFAGKTVSTTAGADGKWRVDLPPMNASKQGRDLIVGLQSNNRTISNQTILHDVLVGEVWFCAGQSNMELRLVGDNPRTRDRNGSLVAQMTVRPFIRFAHMKTGVKMTPQAKAAHPVVWKDFRPENLQTNVSALAFYYGLELYGALDVPIGLVGVYRGGSRLEPWVPNEGFRSVPEMKAQAEYVPVEKGFSKEALLVLNPKIMKSHLSTIFQPSVHWNAMVEPWAPYACRGLIWYQGEANAAEGDDYIPKLQALYNGWAKRFENKDLSLYLVQLAPMDAGTVALQEAQQKFADREPHAAIAIITDLGNTHDIHPNEKEFVAKRLAVHALKRDYGFAGIKDESPAFEGVRFEGTNAVVRLRNAESLYIYNRDRSMTTGFELAGADGQWKPATVVNLKTSRWSNGKTFTPGTIDGKEIVLTARGVDAPKSVRYLHAKPFFGNVYNEVDLPLGPFHSDAEGGGK